MITPTELANVLLFGGNLPERPIIITFDDGNLDIYQNAFPIMREFGYPGALYIIGTYFQGGSRYYLGTDQIIEMANAGWEIGSHSMTHKDLTTDYSSLNYEIRQSKLILEEAIGQPINTFSFPYGKTDSFITTKVSEYGYLAAVSLGLNYKQSLGSIFFLTRIEVRGDFDLAKFGSLLPWHGN